MAAAVSPQPAVEHVAESLARAVDSRELCRLRVQVRLNGFNGWPLHLFVGEDRLCPTRDCCTSRPDTTRFGKARSGFLVCRPTLPGSEDIRTA